MRIAATISALGRAFVLPAACALVAACALFGPAKPAKVEPPPLTIGVELPLRGDSGAEGLQALGGITEAVGRYNAQPNVRHLNIVVKDTSLNGYANAHQDEGVDASGLPPQAASIVAEFGKDANVGAVIGGLDPSLAAADVAAAKAAQMPLIALAPVADDCAAARAQTGAPFPGAVSVAGAASLEALAVARVVAARRYRALAIMSEFGVRPRAALAVCFMDTIERQNSRGRILAPGPISDFPTLARRAAARELDGFVYFGPASRGALVCGAAGVRGLSAATLQTFARRGYDSTTLPGDCAWVRQVLDAKVAGRFALERLAAIVALGSAAHGAEQTSNVRAEILRRLRAPCTAGTADRATFALVPKRDWLRSSLVVYDARCTRI